jgi:hypothetical protein
MLNQLYQIAFGISKGGGYGAAYFGWRNEERDPLAGQFSKRGSGILDLERQEQ